jgi:hypothetical protein
MGFLVQLTQRTKLSPRPHHGTRPPLQLDLVLDDVRLQGITAAQRQTVLRALARLLLEAGDVATREVDDDHA